MADDTKPSRTFQDSDMRPTTPGVGLKDLPPPSAEDDKILWEIEERLRKQAEADACAPELPNLPQPPQRTGTDVSGALAWSDAVRRPDGSMRAWVELDDAGDAMLWTASLILLALLEAGAPRGAPPPDWRGLRVLDLSSGTGHLAVGLSRLGAHVTATESDRVGTGHRSLCNWAAHLLSEKVGLT
jgi:hypothetical protein